MAEPPAIVIPHFHSVSSVDNETEHVLGSSGNGIKYGFAHDGATASHQTWTLQRPPDQVPASILPQSTSLSEERTVRHNLEQQSRGSAVGDFLSSHDSITGQAGNPDNNNHHHQRNTSASASSPTFSSLSASVSAASRSATKSPPAAAHRQNDTKLLIHNLPPKNTTSRGNIVDYLCWLNLSARLGAAQVHVDILKNLEAVTLSSSDNLASPQPIPHINDIISLADGTTVDIATALTKADGYDRVAQSMLLQHRRKKYSHTHHHSSNHPNQWPGKKKKKPPPHHHVAATSVSIGKDSCDDANVNDGEILGGTVGVRLSLASIANSLFGYSGSNAQTRRTPPSSRAASRPTSQTHSPALNASIPLPPPHFHSHFSTSSKPANAATANTASDAVSDAAKTLDTLFTFSLLKEISTPFMSPSYTQHHDQISKLYIGSGLYSQSHQMPHDAAMTRSESTSNLRTTAESSEDERKSNSNVSSTGLTTPVDDRVSRIQKARSNANRLFGQNSLNERAVIPFCPAHHLQKCPVCTKSKPKTLSGTGIEDVNSIMAQILNAKVEYSAKNPVPGEGLLRERPRHVGVGGWQVMDMGEGAMSISVGSASAPPQPNKQTTSSTSTIPPSASHHARSVSSSVADIMLENLEKPRRHMLFDFVADFIMVSAIVFAHLSATIAPRQGRTEEEYERFINQPIGKILESCSSSSAAIYGITDKWYDVLADVLTSACLEGYLVDRWDGLDGIDILLRVGCSNKWHKRRSNDSQQVFASYYTHQGTVTSPSAIVENDSDDWDYEETTIEEMKKQEVSRQVDTLVMAAKLLFGESTPAQTNFENVMKERMLEFLEIPTGMSLADHLSNLRKRHRFADTEDKLFTFLKCASNALPKPDVVSYASLAKKGRQQTTPIQTRLKPAEKILNRRVELQQSGILNYVNFHNDPHLSIVASVPGFDQSQPVVKRTAEDDALLDADRLGQRRKVEGGESL